MNFAREFRFLSAQFVLTPALEQNCSAFRQFFCELFVNGDKKKGQRFDLALG
jgi:hypothetical protein